MLLQLFWIFNLSKMTINYKIPLISHAWLTLLEPEFWISLK